MNHYNLPYLILLFIYLLLSFYERKSKNKNNIRILCGFLFLFFFGFRGFIGTDWHNYYIHYNNLNNLSFFQSGFEPGYFLISKFAKTIGLNFHLFVFFITALDVFLLNNFLKRFSINVSFSYMVLISIFPILIIDAIRNFLAILVALQALKYIDNKSLFKQLLWLVLSSTIHYSTIVILIIFLFLNKKYIPLKTLWVLFVLGLMIYFLQINYLSEVLLFIAETIDGIYGIMINEYLASEQYNTPYGLSIGILEKIFFSILILINYYQFINNKKINPFILNSFFIYTFSFLYLNELNIMINRITLLFFYSYLIVLTHISFSKIAKSNSYIIFYITVFLLFSKTYIQYNKPIYEYKNIIFQEENYNKRINNLRNHYEFFGY